MFCPKCGNPDQSPETFCRRCGTFLPDLSKPIKSPVSPQTHVTANAVLSLMTIVASFTLAILLWSILGFRPDTHPLIYASGGLLIAIGFWQIQTFWRSILLRKYLKRMDPKAQKEDGGKPQLEPADLESFVPDSITERTTRDLAGARKRST